MILHLPATAISLPVGSITVNLSDLPDSGRQVFKLTSTIHNRFNDPYDVYDPFTPSTEQRQQDLPSAHHASSATDPSQASTSSSNRVLRRIRHLNPTQSNQRGGPAARQSQIEAASVGIPNPRVPYVRSGTNEERARSYDHLSSLGESSVEYRSGLERQDTRTSHRRPLHISRHTASAILYTLEVALRQPNPFTPDLLEENASMSDLRGDPALQTPRPGNGNGVGMPRFQGAGAPAPTGSPIIKGPRDIMRERQAREARRRAERDALERAKAEEDARHLEVQEELRSAEQRGGTTGAVGGAQVSSGDPVYRNSEGISASQSAAGQKVGDSTQRSERRGGGEPPSGRVPDVPIQGRGTGGKALGGGEAVFSAGIRPRITSSSQQQTRPVHLATSSGALPSQPVPPAESTTSKAQQDAGEAGAASRRATQSSFPHAFERWETLSAHWEGLTSFWIRRLEENSTEIQNNPISAQLSRQVTDLSAAGANLFHAVVELQRLRASSERKFQRWFFETRSDQERYQEMQAMLEATIEEERRGRAEAIAQAVAQERERNNSDKLLTEMKRELQISKEEARRAWEELGRREQEERERTASLRDGQPTLVGGVQVVPMMQSAPSRHESSAKDTRPQIRDGPHAGGPGPNVLGGQTEIMEDPEPAYQRTRANTNDPFVDSPRRADTTQAASGSRQTAGPSGPGAYHSSAPAVQPTSSTPIYQPQGRANLAGASSDNGPQGTYGEGEYDQRDSQGRTNRSPGGRSSDDDEEYDSAAERARELSRLQQYDAPLSGVEYVPGLTSATSGRGGGQPVRTEPSPVVDYSGQDWGGDHAWDAIPRHHHPTRLSDVLEEEDERSRTSTSQISRRE